LPAKSIAPKAFNLSFRSSLGPQPYLLEQAHEFCLFATSQYSHGLGHVSGVLLKGFLNEAST
jgi:hypothetical protein